MNRKDFTAKSPGKLVRNLQGQTTFVPNPLPPVLALPPTLLRRIGVVDNMLGRRTEKRRRCLIAKF
jgi:hypothetical protein